MCLNSILLIFYYGLLFAFYGFDTILLFGENPAQYIVQCNAPSKNIHTRKNKKIFFSLKKRVEEKKKSTQNAYTHRQRAQLHFVALHNTLNVVRDYVYILHI